ncbi:RES family NAD+ phosphorylase [Nisaea sediminum]|uniref:RES family NAD+ phosphorylase n=1 Tax=Nisaea sediminum TaxID=2775867 RepID=UPI0029C0D7C8|nr:RES family NAD+ phosphorylase [Nisaea sediminum]
MSEVPHHPVAWSGARRIIRSLYPPIDLFEDIADPEDWLLILSAEQKTNPRLLDQVGRLDLVPEGRRVSGPGSSYLMAPFTHASRDRPSRFSDGSFGVLYAGDRFEVALAETIHHHERFMRATEESPGWTSQFRELVLDIAGTFADLRETPEQYAAELAPDEYAAARKLGYSLKEGGSDGLVYPSVRYPEGNCAALFYPDLARPPSQGRHLDYHWDGAVVDLVRDNDMKQVFRVAR